MQVQITNRQAAQLAPGRDGSRIHYSCPDISGASGSFDVSTAGKFSIHHRTGNPFLTVPLAARAIRDAREAERQAAKPARRPR